MLEATWGSEGGAQGTGAAPFSQGGLVCALCASVCACLCMHMCACVHVCMHVCVHVYALVCAHVCVCVCAYHLPMPPPPAHTSSDPPQGLSCFATTAVENAKQLSSGSQNKTVESPKIAPREHCKSPKTRKKYTSL